MKLKDKNLYLVGGYVRDEILGLKSLDIDYCYEGNAIEFAQNLKIIKTNPDFGTVRVSIDNTDIDIASTRTETYPEVGHLPVVNKIGCPLEEDLKRRDFTINALAKNTLTSEIIDYFNGLEDLKNKKIRVLHEKSFIDDPSRIIRGLKFAVRFNFELENHTKELQDNYLNNINYDLSYHRLKKELKETFDLNIENTYKKFIDNGIYKLLGPNQVIPHLKHEIEILINKYSPKLKYMIYLGLFDLSNFELNCEEKDILESFAKIKEQKPSNDFETYKLFCKIPLESILLYAITINPEVAIKYIDNLSSIKIEINGEDLQKLGIVPSPIYNDVFNYVLEEKILTPSLTKKDEIRLVKEKFLC